MSTGVKDRREAEAALKARLHDLVRTVEDRIDYKFLGVNQWTKMLGLERAIGCFEKYVADLDRASGTPQEQSTLGEVKVLLERLQTDVSSLKTEQPKSTTCSRPWRELFDEFLAAEVQGTGRYRGDVRQRADRWGEFVDPQVPVSDFDYSRIEKIMVGLRDRGRKRKDRRKLKKRTLSVHLATLRRFLAWCKKHKYVEANAAEDYHSLRNRRDDRRKRKALTLDEARRLLEVCRAPVVQEVSYKNRKSGKQTWNPPQHLWWLFFIALKTGLRRSNVLKLRWSHLDLDKGCLDIPATEMKNATRLGVPLDTEVVHLLRARKETGADVLKH